MDGTLLSHNTKSVPDSTRRAIQRLQEKGIQYVVATGRHKKILEMLEFVKLGVAMGNADSCVKENADYVTASVDDDGIEKALIDLGLLA